MKCLNKIIGMVATLLAASVLSGCGLKEYVHANDSRYGVQGVFDTALDTTLRTYFINNFLDQYRISHQWTYKGCNYSANPIPTPGVPQDVNNPFWRVSDIIEQDDKTWHRRDDGRLRDMSRFFRETYTTPAPISTNGQITYSPDVVRTQPGFRPLCFDYWMLSSHYIRLRIQKRSLEELQNHFSNLFPEGKWQAQTLNGHTWRVQEVSLNQLRPPRPNGVGGPYLTWITDIGASGYVMALEMGANSNSIQNSTNHQAIEALFMRIVESVTIEVDQFCETGSWER
jgi:hypothetical protein